MRRFAAATAVPWANGRGTTTPMVGDAEARGLTPGRSWRLSVAALAGPAPFSSLPGVHRTFLPSGADVVLEIDGATHEVLDGVAVSFAGGAGVALVALSRPCHAVNLMTEDARTGVAPAAGTVLVEEVLAVLLQPAPQAERFDLVRLPAGTPLPASAAVLHAADPA